MKRWSDTLAPLSQAGLDLLRAEYGVVSTELRTSWRILLKALLLLLVGVFVLFWAVGVVAVVLVEVGALWLPRWGAALAVLGLFLLVGASLAFMARARMRRVERPDQTVRRRVLEHRDWWDRRIAAVGRRGRDGGLEQRGGASRVPGRSAAPHDSAADSERDPSGDSH